MEVQNKVEKYSQVNEVSCLSWNLQSTNIFFLIFIIKNIEDRVEAIDNNWYKIYTDTHQGLLVKVFPPMGHKKEDGTWPKHYEVDTACYDLFYLESSKGVVWVLAAHL